MKKANRGNSVIPSVIHPEGSEHDQDYRCLSEESFAGFFGMCGLPKRLGAMSPQSTLKNRGA